MRGCGPSDPLLSVPPEAPLPGTFPRVLASQPEAALSWVLPSARSAGAVPTGWETRRAGYRGRKAMPPWRPAGTLAAVTAPSLLTRVLGFESQLLCHSTCGQVARALQ